MIVKNGIPITLNLSTTLDAVFNFILSFVIGCRLPLLSIRSDKPFFLKTFLAGLLFFLFHYQTVTIMCIKKALKVLQNGKTVVSLSHN